MYADKVTNSMRTTIDETNRRREKQMAYNKEMGLVPTALKKSSVKVGAPTVAGAKVVGEVVEQARGPKLIAFKKRRRKNSRRKRGHRQDLTKVRITEIVGA